MPGSAIRPCPLPADALLARYAGAGAYTDCYALDVAGAVSHAAYVEAFYTGRMFKIERFLLGLLLSKPSTDIRGQAAGDRKNRSLLGLASGRPKRQSSAVARPHQRQNGIVAHGSSAGGGDHTGNPSVFWVCRPGGYDRSNGGATHGHNVRVVTLVSQALLANSPGRCACAPRAGQQQ